MFLQQILPCKYMRHEMKITLYISSYILCSYIFIYIYIIFIYIYIYEDNIYNNIYINVITQNSVESKRDVKNMSKAI